MHYSLGEIAYSLLYHSEQEMLFFVNLLLGFIGRSYGAKAIGRFCVLQTDRSYGAIIKPQRGDLFVK